MHIKKNSYICSVNKKKHHTMKLTESNTKSVNYDRIEKETEKAYLVSLPVNWNGKAYTRKFWIPKSCLILVNAQVMRVADFIIEKLSRENSCNGYQMQFGI